MRGHIAFTLTVLAVSPGISISAQAVGRIVGKVTDKNGQPISGAQVVLKRPDSTWTKTLTTDAKGAYSQVGLEPREYDVTFSAPGFVGQLIKIKIPLDGTISKDVVLLKVGEAPSTPTEQAPDGDEATKLENDALGLFNDNLELFKAGKYAEALQPFEAAYKGLNSAFAKKKDDMAKGELQPKLDQVGRLLGLTYFQVGKKAEAEPLLLAAVQRDPQDQNALIGLVEVYRFKKDAENEKKYQAELDKLVGPRPEIAYNEAVNFFNEGNPKQAKVKAEKAISIDPKYADAYYLLGIVEIGEGRMAAAKAAFQKYLELAPTGKKAGEVKAILKELR